MAAEPDPTIVIAPQPSLPTDSVAELDQAVIVINNLEPAITRVSASDLLAGSLIQTLRNLLINHKIAETDYEAYYADASRRRKEVLIKLIGQGIVSPQDVDHEWNNDAINDDDRAELLPIAEAERPTLGFSTRAKPRGEVLAEVEPVIAVPYEIRSIVKTYLTLFNLSNANLAQELKNIYQEALGGGISWQEYDYLYSELRETGATYLGGLIDKGLLREPKSRLMANYQAGLITAKQYLDLVDRLDQKQHGRGIGFLKGQQSS